MQVIKSSCPWTSPLSACLPQRRQCAARLRDGSRSCGLSESKPASRCPEASAMYVGWCWASGKRPNCPSTRSSSSLRAAGRWHPYGGRSGRTWRPSPQRSFFRLIRFPYCLSFSWYCFFCRKGIYNLLLCNGFAESGSVLRRYGSHCPWVSYRNGSFRMNAVQTERLTISQSAYLIVLYIVVWWNKVLVVWRVTTLRHEIIKSMYHQIVRQPLFDFPQYSFGQVFNKSFW